LPLYFPEYFLRKYRQTVNTYPGYNKSTTEKELSRFIDNYFYIELNNLYLYQTGFYAG